MKSIRLLSLCAALAFLPSALLGYGSKTDYASDKKSKHPDLVAVAASNETFSTLVAAVKAAGLVETLQGKGPFTVFAPTDEAFAALPEGTLDSLLMPENRDQLIAILTYHVVPAKVKADQVTEGPAPTVNGKDLQISIEDGSVRVNDATVLKTDVMASNGVIHVVDQVILPPQDDAMAMY